MTRGAFYNEHDPFAAQWLRNLIAAGHIAPGEVDERSITEISPDDLRGFTQCHFFAGIGVWSHALRRAGWPDDVPVWTGSCPCQPFSAAGKQQRFADDRHLWPAWFALIAKCRPAVVLGEQVASALDWVDLVSADLENSDYAFGAADLCAAGFQGAHIRQRLYFVGLADAINNGHRQHRLGLGGPPRASEGKAQQRQRVRAAATDGRAVGGLAHPVFAGWPEWRPFTGRGQVAGCRTAGRMAYADGWNAVAEREQRSGQHGCEPADGSALPGTACDPGEVDARWAHVDWLLCRNPSGEPSWRPVEPRTFPLAHGVAGRMGKLRAYGNALDAETAAQFCAAVVDHLRASERQAA